MNFRALALPTFLFSLAVSLQAVPSFAQTRNRASDYSRPGQAAGLPPGQNNALSDPRDPKFEAYVWDDDAFPRERPGVNRADGISMVAVLVQCAVADHFDATQDGGPYVQEAAEIAAKSRGMTKQQATDFVTRTRDLLVKATLSVMATNAGIVKQMEERQADCRSITTDRVSRQKAVSEAKAAGKTRTAGPASAANGLDPRRR